MELIVAANRKGGTGKSTVVQNLMYLFAHRHGLKVLGIDADSQANLSLLSGFGVAYERPDSLEAHVRAHLRREPIFSPAMLAPNLGLLTGSLSIAYYNEIAALHNYVDALRSIIDKAAAAGYDLAIIDTPPGSGTLLLGSLAAASQVLAVSELGSILSANGLAVLLEDIQDVNRRYRNASADLLGVLPTFATRELVSVHGLLELRASLNARGVHLFDPIRRDAKVKKAALAKRPVVEMYSARASAAAADYISSASVIAAMFGY